MILFNSLFYGDIMTELQSLKNPTRILTAVMFIAFIIYSIGMDGLSQALPFVPQVIITAIFGAATFLVTQYGTEKRVVRAEEMKDAEYAEVSTESLDIDADNVDIDMDDVDGV